MVMSSKFGTNEFRLQENLHDKLMISYARDLHE